MGLLISILTSVIAVAVFFYKKDGQRYEVKGVGIIIIMGVFLIAVLNVYSSYHLREAKVRNNQENTILKNENRMAQTHLQMQYLNLKTPFNTGMLAFSTTYPKVNSVVKTHPYGSTHLNLFPIPSKPGTIGTLWIELVELEEIRVQLESIGKDKLKIRQESHAKKQIKMDYDIYWR